MLCKRNFKCPSYSMIFWRQTLWTELGRRPFCQQTMKSMMGQGFVKTGLKHAITSSCLKQPVQTQQKKFAGTQCRSAQTSLHTDTRLFIALLSLSTIPSRFSVQMWRWAKLPFFHGGPWPHPCTNKQGRERE